MRKKTQKRRYNNNAATEISYVLKAAKKETWFSVKSISKALEIGESTVRAVLNRLWKEGLVNRSVDPTDARFVYQRLFEGEL